MRGQPAPSFLLSLTVRHPLIGSAMISGTEGRVPAALSRETPLTEGLATLAAAAGEDLYPGMQHKRAPVVIPDDPARLSGGTGQECAGGLLRLFQGEV